LLSAAAAAAVAVAQEPIGLLHSIVLGIVEGLTEFLPVSSTGHLIVANALMGRSEPAFEVAIQIGAITAIVVLYRAKLLAAARDLLGVPASTDAARAKPRVNLFLLLLVAALPAASLGLLIDDWIEERLFDTTVVATTTVVGGVLLLVLEAWLRRRERAGHPPDVGVDAMTLRHAFVIGMFQCLALIPGTSRSGSTIAGALIVGMRRPAAAEFSFLVGLPILYGACGWRGRCSSTCWSRWPQRSSRRCSSSSRSFGSCSDTRSCRSPSIACSPASRCSR
jgi:undecaprenyl-diphosphatase